MLQKSAYYAQNYAGIIGSSLDLTEKTLLNLINNQDYPLIMFLLLMASYSKICYCSYTYKIWLAVASYVLLILHT